MVIEIELVEICCADCARLFWIAKSMDTRLRSSHRGFYCPRGHSNVYVKKTDLDIANTKVQNQLRTIEELRTEIGQLKTPKKKRKAAPQKQSRGGKKK